jgi:hypothetical protein
MLAAALASSVGDAVAALLGALDTAVVTAAAAAAVGNAKPSGLRGCKVPKRRLKSTCIEIINFTDG